MKNIKYISKEFLSSLEGYHQVLKELHWSTTCKAEHLLTDDIDGDVLDYEDRIAECVMGKMNTRFGIGDLKSLLPNGKTLDSVLKEMDKDVADYKKEVDNGDYAGLVNILDDFAESIAKWNYLRTFS